MNYYHILDVRNDATLKEININFKELSTRYHPDRNPDDKYSEEKMKLISRAYTVLSDYDRRINYDSELVEQPKNIDVTQSNTDQSCGLLLIDKIFEETKTPLLLTNNTPSSKSTLITEDDSIQKKNKETIPESITHTFF